MRHKILKMLTFIPDRTMIDIQYRIKFGHKPNLDNPRSFSEKLQYYKLHYRNPALGNIVDKYRVREYLKEKGFGHLLPELYGVYRRAEEIDYDRLPDQFVLKTNDGSGGHNIVICRDKSNLDKEATAKLLNSWLNKKNANLGREWAYTQIKESLIIAEQYLENKENPELGIEDIKFYCFNGKPYCIAFDGERYIRHKRNFYDPDWNDLKVGSDCDNFDHPIPRPSNLEEMLETAAKLSQGFPHVRVDLYSLEGKIYFGEMTFYPLSGYVEYTPREFDFRLGEQFDVTTFGPLQKKD